MKRNMSVTDNFLEEYKQIKAPRDIPFDERLKFDISKRRCKIKNYDRFLAKCQKRLPAKELDTTFDNLIQDAVRRASWLRQIEKTEPQKKEDTKRLSREEGIKLYDKGMRELSMRKEKCEKKRKEKEEKEVSIIKQYNHIRASSVGVLERMDDDIKLRKERYKAALKAKEDKEKCEVSFLV